MKYKNGVWHSNNFKEMNRFFSHEDDQLKRAPPEPLVYAPDHTDLIWDRKFQVVVPIVAVKSIETLRRRGLVLTGIKEIDERAHERLIYPYLSINDIIEVEDKGFEVNYLSLNTVIEIYNTTKEYLDFWKGIINTRTVDVHSFRDYPVDDISRIESFMHSIYPLVSKSVGKEDRTWGSLMGRFMVTAEATLTTPKIVKKDDETESKNDVVELVPNQGLPNTLGEI